jgi:hypothetical protein
MPLFSFPVSAPSFQSTAPTPTDVDTWHQSAKDDYQLCRRFADKFDAQLGRSHFSPRVGWDRDGHGVYGILLPDPLPTVAGDDWYIYSVWGETMFRRTRKERENLRLLILPESVEDWVELLRQALRDTVFEVRYEVRPHFLNALGDVETVPLGYEFALSSCAPHTASATSFWLSATADTPEGAAREVCRRWLERQ